MNLSQSKNSTKKQSKICLVPRLTGIGGMVSFQAKLAEGLSRRGISVCYELNGIHPESILVIGGTRNLHQLWKAKRRGSRIVQRLNGMNWIHRVRNTGVRHWLRAEYGNIILGVIRSYLADKIAYQSRFSKEWWERVKGETTCNNVIIHNGVNLTKFQPGDHGGLLEDPIQLLLVEGSLLGGYEFGLENAIQLANEVAKRVKGTRRVELGVVGKVSVSLKEFWDNWLKNDGVGNSLKIKWLGTIAHEEIPAIYQQAHLLFSADINAACPNSVIESMASGTPVIAFDTGALPELLEKSGGIVVPYEGDPWQIETPDIPSLAEGALSILNNLEEYRKSARERAESAFDLESMVDQYVEFMLE
jgi:glycosyltransferase involved in cell wall biosynthesis